MRMKMLGTTILTLLAIVSLAYSAPNGTRASLQANNGKTVGVHSQVSPKQHQNMTNTKQHHKKHQKSHHETSSNSQSNKIRK